MKKTTIQAPVYQLVENVDIDIYLPTTAVCYELGRKEWLGVYPRCLKDQDVPFEYKWIHLCYDAFDISIQRGCVSVHNSALERLHKIKGVSGIQYKDKVNLQLLNFLMDYTSYDGDYSIEYFEEQLNSAIDELVKITKRNL